MSKKISILSDKIGKLILSEVSGISFEVRDWATIIKNLIVLEYQKYWDEYTKRRRSQNYGGNYRNYNRWDFPITDDFGGMFDEPDQPRKINTSDLAFMSPKQFDDMYEIIALYHGLSMDAIVKLKPAKLVKLYNITLENTPKSNDPAPTTNTTSDQTELKRPTQIIINGKDFPDQYAKFSVDKWVVSDGQPTEYDHRNSGYQPNGEYVVFINCNLSEVSLFVLIHEIKHAYQDWNRMSKGKPPIRQSKELQQLYTADFEKYILSHQGGYHLKTLESIISAYYMSSNAEIAAYLESAYDDIQLKSPSTQLVTKFYDLGIIMTRFKASNVEPTTPAKTLQKKWVNIITNYDIPLFRKFKNVFDFLKYTEKLFNKKGKYIMTKVDKLRTMEKR